MWSVPWACIRADARWKMEDAIGLQSFRKRLAAAKKPKFSPPAIAKISTRILEIKKLNRGKNDRYIVEVIK